MGLDRSKPVYGLILTPSEKLAKPHKCNTPGWFTHFWYWLFREPIKENSVWRCECGEVWQWRELSGWHDDVKRTIWWHGWSANDSIEAWIAAGGRS